MEKNWLKQYDNGVPHSLEPYPELTLLDIVHETAIQRPDHPALLFKGAKMSYGQLDRLSDVFAAALVGQGVDKGDRVALLMPNCPQFVIGQLGAWKAGAIVVPINPLYTESELSQKLAGCGAEVALVLTPFYAKVKAAQPLTSLRCIIATNIKEYLPEHLRVLFTAIKEKKEGHRITLQESDLWLSDLLRKYSKTSRPEVSANPQDLAIFLCTGGTTGLPKSAMGTHQGLLMTAMQLKAWSFSHLTDWEDVVMGNMPLFHVMGIAILCLSLLGHHPLTLIPNPRDFDDLLETIKRDRPALLPAVPTLLSAILSHPKVRSGKADLQSIKLCVSSTSVLLNETKKRFEAVTGGRVFEGYGLTESMAAIVGTPIQGTNKPGSVGVPLPDVEIRIVDTEDGHTPRESGQVGEIVMRAPQLMKGYWQQPVETAEMLRDGWLFTGDLGYMDEDGYLFIAGRKKDLIKASGYQVWPREVEEVIASHPAVAEVGVAGVPDQLRGEVVKAWVVLRAGQKVTGAEIRAYCREKLVDYKVPRQVEFRDSLPKTMVGKILRRELIREDIESRTSSDQAKPQVGVVSQPSNEMVSAAPTLLAS